MTCHPTLRAISPDGSCPLGCVGETTGDSVSQGDSIIEVLTRNIKLPELVPLVPKEPRAPRVREVGWVAPKVNLYWADQTPVQAVQEAVTQAWVWGELTLEEIEADQCRRSLSYFVRTAWRSLMPGIPLHWNWHLEEMCNHVQGMLEEWINKQRNPAYELRAQNLAMNCPPRSLKSTIVSVCAPAWMWLQWPSFKFLFVSANPSVKNRDAHACANLIQKDWYTSVRATLAEQWPQGSEERKRYEWTITRDGVEQFENSAGGIRMATSFAATITGIGADGIFIDDPNDTKKVMAEAERAKINDTWDLALCNRVNSYTDSIRVMIMQRCHEMDLTGHWHESMPDELTVYLAMPLEYDADMAFEAQEESPFGYHDPRKVPGEVIHGARFTQVVIEAERKRLGPYGFAGQMNQKPVPLEGGAFKRAWWRFCHVESPDPWHHPMVGTMLEGQWQKKVDGARFIAKKGNGAVNRPMGCDMDVASKPIPFLDALIITVDATFGALKETSSRVGLLAVGIHGADRYVLEDRTLARNFVETCAAIRDLKKAFPSVSTILIERKANGQAVIDTMNSEIGGLTAIDDNSNWMVRANAMLPYVASGNWYLLDGAPWLTAYVSEFAMFPNGAHDDRIDSSSQLSNYYSGGVAAMPDW